MRIIIASSLSLFIFGTALAHHKETFEYIKRVPPVMPQQSSQSGYCCMTYDIDKYGLTKNISASYCTEAYLAEPSKQALAKWIYDTKKKDGTNVKSESLTTYMSFVLTDQFGAVIPGKNDFMTKKPDGSYNKEKTCGLLVS